MRAKARMRGEVWTEWRRVAARVRRDAMTQRPISFVASASSDDRVRRDVETRVSSVHRPRKSIGQGVDSDSGGRVSSSSSSPSIAPSESLKVDDSVSVSGLTERLGGGGGDRGGVGMNQVLAMPVVDPFAPVFCAPPCCTLCLVLL